jgi:hypothetical protein
LRIITLSERVNRQRIEIESHLHVMLFSSEDPLHYD